MVDHTAGKVVLAAFAIICALQDIRSMSIRIEVVIAGFIAIAFGAMLGQGAVLRDIMLGMIPGLMMLLVSHMSGQIGAGDGLYFIVVGAALGLKDVTALLAMTMFANALISALILIKSMIVLKAAGDTEDSEDVRGKTGSKSVPRAGAVLKKRMPFLPAATAFLIWMIVRW